MRLIFFMLTVFISQVGYGQQFALVANPTSVFEQINDTTYSASFQFSADQTGNNYLPTQILADGSMRLFFQNGRTYTVTGVADATFSDATLTFKNYNSFGEPSGQAVVYAPTNRATVPIAPANATGSSPALASAIINYNFQFTASDFNGSFDYLTDIPEGLADGDDDTQLTEAQVDSYVANNGYLTDFTESDPIWLAEKADYATITYVNANDDDTQLTEAQVDSYVANNGYLTSLSWNDLQDIPVGFQDGIDNTADGSGSTDWSEITNIPAAIADGDDDTQLTEAQVDSYVSNNGYLTAFTESDPVWLAEKTDYATITYVNANDNDTQLTEAQVDSYVSNNGYLTAFTESDPIWLAEKINYATTAYVDANDDDTQLTEAQVDSYVSNNGYLTAFTESDPIWLAEKVDYATITYVNANDDDTQLTEAQVDNYVSNNGYLTDFTESDPIWLAEKVDYATTAYVDANDAVNTVNTTTDVIPYWDGDSWESTAFAFSGDNTEAALKVANTSALATFGGIDKDFIRTGPSFGLVGTNWPTATSSRGNVWAEFMTTTNSDAHFQVQSWDGTAPTNAHFRVDATRTTTFNPLYLEVAQLDNTATTLLALDATGKVESMDLASARTPNNVSTNFIPYWDGNSWEDTDYSYSQGTYINTLLAHDSTKAFQFGYGGGSALTPGGGYHQIIGNGYADPVFRGSVLTNFMTNIQPEAGFLVRADDGENLSVKMKVSANDATLNVPLTVNPGAGNHSLLLQGTGSTLASMYIGQGANAGDYQFRTNVPMNSIIPDNPAVPSYLIRMGYHNDDLAFFRSPAGATTAFKEIFRVDETSASFGNQFNFYKLGPGDVAVADLHLGDDTRTTDDNFVGARIAAWSNGNIYYQNKTHTDGSLIWSIGSGTDIGSAHDVFTIDGNTGNYTLHQAMILENVPLGNGDEQLLVRESDGTVKKIAPSTLQDGTGTDDQTDAEVATTLPRPTNDNSETVRGALLDLQNQINNNLNFVHPAIYLSSTEIGINFGFRMNYIFQIDMSQYSSSSPIDVTIQSTASAAVYTLHLLNIDGATYTINWPDGFKDPSGTALGTVEYTTADWMVCYSENTDAGTGTGYVLYCK